jgi:acetyltransferase
MTIEKTGNEGWKSLFYPSSIAVIGASPDLLKPGGNVLANLRSGGFRGEVYPVNPKHKELNGWRCFPDLASLPEPVDLAIIAVKSPQVIPVLKECAARGAGAVIIFSSGFGEVDDAGLELQHEIREAAKALNIRVCGPNTMGVINYLHHMQADFVYGYSMTAPSETEGAGIALICQSGGVGCSILEACTEYGLEVAIYVCTGNEAATDFADYLTYFVRHPRIKMVASYMEGIRDGGKLARAADLALAAGKPLVILKTGQHEASARAASSHTGALAGSAAVYRSFFRQKGIIDVQNISEMVAVLSLLATGRRPAGNRVAIMASSGGHAVVATDKCSSAGLEVTQLSTDTRQRLAEYLPSFAGTANPVDFTGLDVVQPGLLRRCAPIAAADPAVDVLVLSHWLNDIVDSISQLHEISACTDKPLVLLGTIPGRSPGGAIPGLIRSGVAYMGEVETATSALAKVAQYAKKVELCASLDNHTPDLPAPAALTKYRTLKPGSLLGEREAKELLAACGIPVVPELTAATVEEALAAAEQLGYPVAVKVDSPDIVHKTEVDGVRLNLAGPEEVRRAFEAVIGNARQRRPGTLIHGVLVQKMLAGGLETLVGISRDPVFGPVLTFGLGGVWVEIMKDVSLRVLPASESDIREMIAEIKAYPLLVGARGRPPADLPALADVITRVARLALEWPELAELDINPLMVMPEGQGVCVVDALAAVAAEKR